MNVAEVTGTYLIGKLVPAGLKTGQRVVAFGFGGKNTAIGKTSTTCPLYPGADKTYYGRTPDYTGRQFNEFLPDGARQG